MNEIIIAPAIKPQPVLVGSEVIFVKKLGGKIIPASLTDSRKLLECTEMGYEFNLLSVTIAAAFYSTILNQSPN